MDTLYRSQPKKLLDTDIYNTQFEKGNSCDFKDLVINTVQLSINLMPKIPHLGFFFSLYSDNGKCPLTP